jgi:hypothetical protein
MQEIELQHDLLQPMKEECHCIKPQKYHQTYKKKKKKKKTEHEDFALSN